VLGATVHESNLRPQYKDTLGATTSLLSAKEYLFTEMRPRPLSHAQPLRILRAAYTQPKRSLVCAAKQNMGICVASRWGTKPSWLACVKMSESRLWLDELSIPRMSDIHRVLQTTCTCQSSIRGLLFPAPQDPYIARTRWAVIYSRWARYCSCLQARAWKGGPTVLPMRKFHQH
jgi:hypothetical protein